MKKSNEPILLEEYIAKYFSSKADFARKNRVLTTAVTKWIKNGWIVYNGELYSRRRAIE